MRLMQGLLQTTGTRTAGCQADRYGLFVILCLAIPWASLCRIHSMEVPDTAGDFASPPFGGFAFFHIQE